MEYKDYYKVLGVPKTATIDEIKKSYKKLAHKYHPDISKEKDAEAKFKEIGEAYSTLKDEEKRTAYDSLGNQSSSRGFQPPPGWSNNQNKGSESFDGMDFSELFAQFGGGAAGTASHRRSMQRPGQDYEITADISLEEVFKGAQLDIDLIVPEYLENGSVQNSPRTFKVRIPKGVTDKQRLRLRGKGGKGLNGGVSGDLYLNVHFKPDTYFTADGHDLYVAIPITPWEACLGGSIEVPTLHGAVKLKLSEGTSSGKKLRLPKKGLPDQNSGHGDLYATIQIVVPSKLTEQEKKLMEDLAEMSGFNPRQHLS
ncbi:MAG: DnaJ domain-containing protein [Methylotenera sp.]|nr:DnaJ domain-containing protein [Methylotenera sp.]